VSSTSRVPETQMMGDEELSGEEAWEALRKYGRWHLLRDAFVRFRYGDGFSHSRALGLQLCLAVVPFLIALTGLASSLGLGAAGRVVAESVLALTPGASEDLVGELLTDEERVRKTGQVVLALGLATAVAALTTAVAQIERGANRIYGVERDRPALRKYIRAFVLAVIAGAPALAGFLILVAGGPIGESASRWYGWSDALDITWNLLRWPLSLGLTVFSVAVLFRHAPRRRQPGLSWLLFGAGLATGLWWLASVLLAWYVTVSGAFDATYGALAGVMALLVWSNLTGVAFFLGLAFAAQLEAIRVGVAEPGLPDQWEAAPRRETAPREEAALPDAAPGQAKEHEAH
jgi:YihY family inner membrane protein